MANLLCKALGHKYSDNQIRSNAYECEQYKVCIRCKSELQIAKTDHLALNYDLKQEPRGSCYFIQRCKICSQGFRGGYKHDVEYLYTSEIGCERIEHCKRCNQDIGEKRIIHTLYWQYISEDRCDLELRCTRCNEVADKKVIHSKEHVSSYTACEQLIHCKRCNVVLDSKERSPHNWQYIRTETEHGARGLQEETQYFKCARCGKEKTEFNWSDDSDRTW